MKTETRMDAWSLEVVRGSDAGRTYALGSGTVVLGNWLDGEPGIDLSDQEHAAPRKMAAKQARIDVVNTSLTLRDLDSPGGTFVNRQRVLPGEGRSLQNGDVIHLGGVQLRVMRGGSGSSQNPAPRPQPGPRPLPNASQGVGQGFVYTMQSGASCRSWDDFLTVSAQRWAELREELTSGRLAGFLASIGRADLSPDPTSPGSPDDRLDAWIGRLPTIKPAKPELDVHPRTLVLRAPAGGGLIRRKIQISNAGYRLLKTKARIEPEGTSWLKVASDFDGKTITTIESDELTIEADLPEGRNEPRSATVVLESNGGSIKVAVRVESASGKDADGPVVASVPHRESLGLRDRLARQSSTLRLAGWPILAFFVRELIGVMDRIQPSAAGSPGLLGPAIGFAVMGSALAVMLWTRGKSEARALPPSLLSGAILGAMLAAILVAMARTIESPFTALLGSSWLVTGLVWGLFAAALASLSLVLAPPSKTEVRS